MTMTMKMEMEMETAATTTMPTTTSAPSSRAPAQPALPQVGTRFSLGTHRGTVRYVGKVPPTDGIWLGVEWDEKDRGKHDGVHQGQRYFYCRQAGAGSFLRPSPKLSYGVSFLRALSSKYLPDASLSANSTAPAKPQTYSRRNLAEIEIKAPNMDGVIARAARLTRLREVGLGGWRAESVQGAQDERYAEVARAWDPERDEKEGVIEKTCPNVRWLDLSRSLLPSWDALSDIARELPRLETLLLHFNRFECLSAPAPANWHGAFKNVRDLRIDGTMMSWQEVLFLAPALPALESLQLGHNEISSLDATSDSAPNAREALASLRVLNLEGNNLSDWEWIVRSLGSLPRLERLILSSNQLSHISPPPIPIADSSTYTTHFSSINAPRHFASLIHVALADNPLKEWSDLEALDAWVRLGRRQVDAAGGASGASDESGPSMDDALQGLQSLVVGGECCELTKALDPRDLNPLAIARLASLQSLNGGIIRPWERKDAELFYLSRTAEQVRDPVERAKKHPRFEQLCQLHGAPTISSETTRKDAGTLRNKLITLKVRLSSTAPSSSYRAPPPPPPADAPSTTAPLELKLLSSTPLRLLRPKLARALGIKVGDVKEIWASLCGSPKGGCEHEAEGGEAEEGETPAGGGADREGEEQERIIFQLDDPTRDLAWYELGPGDELVVVRKS